MKLYKSIPIKTVNNIPYFSVFDNYTKNYEDISVDHTKSIHGGNQNPWITTDIWNEMERSTIDLFTDHSSVMNKLEKVKVLDVGVGLGRLMEKLSEKYKNIDVYGMDIATPYLEIAQAKGIDVCYSKIEDIPYCDNFFDVIFCTDVLEHVIDLNLCITKIFSVLKEGGLLIVRVPNMEDLSPYFQSNYPYNLAHVRNFDSTSLEALFSKIFPHKVLAFSPGLYEKRINWLKYNLPFKLYHRILFKILKILKILNPAIEDKFVKKLFHPIEINVAIRKS